MLIKHGNIKEPLGQFRVSTLARVDSQLEAISARQRTVCPTFGLVGPAKKSPYFGQAQPIIGVEKRYDYDSCIENSTTTKTHFREWPRGGRAGLKRFDKTRIDAGTLRGLLRVTVNGISAPTTTQRLCIFSPSITILTSDFDLRVFAPSLPSLLVPDSIPGPHSYILTYSYRDC